MASTCPQMPFLSLRKEVRDFTKPDKSSSTLFGPWKAEEFEFPSKVNGQGCVKYGAKGSTEGLQKNAELKIPIVIHS